MVPLGQTEKFGCSTFSSSLSLEELQHKEVNAPLTLGEILKTSQWLLESQYKSWSSVFLKMISTTVNHIDLRNNHYSSIIRDISHINFQSLEQLVLFSNNISSVESVIRLQTPALWLLSLSYNSLIEMKSLRKTRLPCLHDLYLNQNMIREISFLEQMWHCSIMKDLTLETSNEALPQGQDISILLKVSIGEFQKLYCESQRRIETKTFDMLRKKYETINMKVE